MLKKLFILTILGALFSLPIIGRAEVRDYNIAIDGNMSDWTDKPKTTITPYDSVYNNHEVSIVSDSDNIYFYVQMAKKGDNNTMITAEYLLDIGGVKFAILMPDVNNPYSGLAITKDTLKIGESKTVAVAAQVRSGESSTLTSNYTVLNDPGVQAIITRMPNENSFVDEMEVKIPFSSLGLESTTSQTITLANPNLGTQAATVSGGSTGAVLLVFAAIILAAFGYATRTNNKKKKI